MQDKSTGHGAQEQDDGQVELELLILVLVGKPAMTDTPEQAVTAPVWKGDPRPSNPTGSIPPSSRTAWLYGC